jgi:hypothetical protein
MSKRRNYRRRALKHLGRVSIGLVTLSLMSPGASAVDPGAEAATQIVASQAGKKALNTALKIAGSRSSLTIATTISCAACVGATYSPALCIACGILVAKTLG